MALARFIDAASSRWRKRFFRSPDAAENPERALGRRGERLAVGYLRRHKFRVLYRNFRGPRGGEVDIVCRDKPCRTLVFVEVKTRRTGDFGGPAAAVDEAKRELITRGALAWLRMLDNPDVLFRFDIMEVIDNGSEVSFNLIQNAFQLPDRYIW